MAVLGGVEVDLVELIQHLADDGAVLHVVVRAFEDIAEDHSAAVAGGDVDVAEAGEEHAVDEVLEFVASHAFGVGGPVSPLEFCGDDGLVVVLKKFKLLVFVVDDLEGDHPAELFDALGVAGDALVLAHDVLKRLDDVADVLHIWGNGVRVCGNPRKVLKLGVDKKAM